jgi:hypothetical protein
LWRGFNKSVAKTPTLYPGTRTWGCDANDVPLTPYCDLNGVLANNWAGIVCGDYDPVTGTFDATVPECNNIIRLELNGMGLALQGSISPFISDLSYLNILSITSAPLKGTIPSSIGNLVHLNELNLFDTGAIVSISPGIKGLIPGSIDQLVHLNYLRLHDNYLQKKIPPTVCNMHSIVELSFQNNLLTGNVPACFCALTKLTNLVLNLNSLACYPDCVINAPKAGGVYPIALSTDPIPSACSVCDTNGTTYGDVAGTLLASTSYYTKKLDAITRYCSGEGLHLSSLVTYITLISCLARPTATPSTLLPSGVPTSLPSSSPTRVPFAPGSTKRPVFPTALSSRTKSPTKSPSSPLTTYCVGEAPACDAAKYDCAAHYAVLVRQVISDVTVGAFDAADFACTIAGTSGLDTAAVALLGVSTPQSESLATASATSVKVSYSIDVPLGAYQFVSSAAAYAAITSALQTAVDNGDFTTMLHSVSAQSSHAFDAPAVTALSIEFDPYIPMTSSPSTADGGQISSVASSQSSTPIDQPSVWYAVIAVVCVVGACIAAVVLTYLYRKYRSSSKLDEIHRIKRPEDGRLGEVVPEHGDLVDCVGESDGWRIT